MNFKVIAVLAVAAAFTYIYFKYVRPHLQDLLTFKEAFAVEGSYLDKLKIYFEGRKVLFAGMWGEIIGMGPDFLQIVSGVDLKSALSLPDNWALLISGIAVPMLMMYFRTKTKSV